MANNINNINDNAAVLCKMAAQLIKEKAIFCANIDKAPESDLQGKNGFKAGSKVDISIPARFVPQNTFDITSSKQDIVEESVALNLDTISTVGIELDSQELAHDIGIESLMKRVIEPAASSIAQDIDTQFLEKATDGVFNSVGTAGSNTFDISTILAARAKLNQYLCPKDNNRTLLLDSAASADAVAARSGLFQSSSQIAKQYEDGLIGRADGFNWYESELLNTHTNGNDAVFEVRTTVSVEGQATLVVEALATTTGTVKKGTVFTIGSVYEVHPITKATTSRLAQFVVTADATADGSGYATLSISKPFYTSASNGLQNIDAFPVDGAAITMVGAASGAYQQNLAFHKSAFRMMSVPLIMPTSAEFAAQETVDGITVSIVRAFNVQTRSMVTRMDFLGGLAVVRPEWACRITA